MKKVTLAKASRPLAQYASELMDDILVVTEGNRPLAALIPLKNIDRESLALSTDPEFLKLMQRARSDFDAGKTMSQDQVRTRVRRMRAPGSAVSEGGGRRGGPSRKRSIRRG